jgi:hypothetical protein
MTPTIQKEQIIMDRKYVEELKLKAFLFEEILSLLENEYLGYLMKQTEGEDNISALKAKKILNK